MLARRRAAGSCCWGANLLFYAVLCPAALPVLPGSSFLVWWCGRRTAKKPVFLAGLAAALLPLALLKYLPAALGWQGTLANALGIGYFTLQLVSYLCDVRRGRILPRGKIRPPFVLCVVLSLHHAGPLQPL